MNYMAGTLSPEQMMQQQLIAEALRAPGTQTSALNTASPGVQMPGSQGGINQFVGNALGGAVKGIMGQMQNGAVFNNGNAIASPVPNYPTVTDITPAGYNG